MIYGKSKRTASTSEMILMSWEEKEGLADEGDEIIEQGVSEDLSVVDSKLFSTCSLVTSCSGR